jgi:hypothetical protein
VIITASKFDKPTVVLKLFVDIFGHLGVASPLSILTIKPV